MVEGLQNFKKSGNMVSKNFSSRRRIALGIMAIMLLLQAVAGAQGNNGSSETGVTYTQDVPFSTESIAQVVANESKLPAVEQRVIPFHKAPAPQVLKQGVTAPLKPLSAVQNVFPSPLAPVLGNNFIGITSAGLLIPPDTMGAAGPSHLMEITNENIGFFNKSTGALISSVLLKDFWAVLGTGSGQPDYFPFDPKVIYDQHSGRFIAVSMGNTSSPSSWLMIAVSNTSDPTGNWSKWAIDADNDSGVHTFDNWADFPGLGVDANNVYVTANMYSNAEVFQYSKVWVVNKTQLLNGNASITLTEFRNPIGNPPGKEFGFTMQPAHVFGSSSAEYFVNENYSCPDPVLPCLALNYITFPGGTPTWNRMGDIAVNNYYNFTLPAPQKGTATLIETNDIRLLNAVFRDGFLWTTHTVVNVSTSKTEVAWYQINPANASLSLPFGMPAQEGRISDASRWYYYPSIAVNAAGDVGIGFSGSSATEYAGAYYTARNASDAPGTMQSVGLLKAGLDSYTVTASGIPRWGDYSATVVDPNDDSTFWTVQEYTNTSTLWGTWWGKFVMGYGVNLTADLTARTTKEGINATYTLTLTNSGALTDSYNLTVDNPDSASVAALNITNITLAANAIQTLLLNVSNTTIGTFRVNVTARSNNDSTKFMFINTTTNVVNYSVNLTVSTTTQTTNASSNATYTIFLQNNGTGDDSYTLAVNNPDNAARANLSIASRVFVNQGATRNFTLNVTNTASGTFSVNVTASSTNDTTKFMFINTTTTVTAVWAVSLAVDSTAKTINAGANATYTLTLRNNGTDPDSYNLTVDNPDNASVAALNTSGNITLAANAIQTLLLNVTYTTSGTFRVNVTARSNNDTTKFMFINTTTTVPNTITGSGNSGSGGGGGGGPSGENYSNIIVKENYDSFIFKDITTSYAFTNNSNPLKFVNITGNTSAGEINTAVEVLKGTSTLVNISPPGIVYKNINIWVGTTGFATPKNIKTAAVEFHVDKNWIKENNIDSSNIKLVRYDTNNKEWVNLPTNKIGENATEIYYQGETDRFSSFAIVGEKNPVLAKISQAPSPVATAGETPAVSESPGKETGSLVPILTYTLVFFVIVYAFRKKRM
jgi:PGF-pre-PGF domain-containing protein